MACQSLHRTGHTRPPDRPARPAKKAPLPRRRTAGITGRIAAIAHIELNAIDLALDMASRFVGITDFYNDWLGVADDDSTQC